MSTFTFFVGTYTTAFSRRGEKLDPPLETGSEGIYSVKFDPVSKKIWINSVVENINPTFISISSDQKKLYAVSEIERFDGINQGAITFYKITSESELTDVQKRGTSGSGPCYVDLHPTQESLVISNYGTGSIVSYSIDQEGNLSDISTFYQHVGESINEIRQLSAHPHSSTFNIKTNQLYVADLGMDKILVYDYEFDKGIVNSRPELDIDTTPGSGPRHFEWHPNGDVLYVINELDCTISVYKCDSDKPLELLQNITTLPEEFDGIISCADIHITSDGKFLYGSNRGHNSIVKFAVNPQDYTLTYQKHFATAGKWTRNFALSPDEEYLFVANQDSDNVVIFERDKITGDILNTGIEIDIPSPVCIKFMK